MQRFASRKKAKFRGNRKHNSSIGADVHKSESMVVGYKFIIANKSPRFVFQLQFHFNTKRANLFCQKWKKIKFDPRKKKLYSNSVSSSISWHETKHVPKARNKLRKCLCEEYQDSSNLVREGEIDQTRRNFTIHLKFYAKMFSSLCCLCIETIMICYTLLLCCGGRRSCQNQH